MCAAPPVNPHLPCLCYSPEMEDVEITVRQFERIEDGRLTGTMEARYAGGEDGQTAGTIDGSRAN